MIPNIFHFVFGLRPQAEPMHIAHFLCLESCRRVYRPDAIHLHYRHLPHGPWWDRIRPHLTLHQVAARGRTLDVRRYRNTEEGRYIERADLVYAHEADFIRLDVLNKWGGVYADMDTLFVQPLPQRLFGESFVVGEEPALTGADGVLRPSLCNALMLARPRATFAVQWRARMEQVFDGTWSRHSCQEAALLWAKMPEAVCVLPQRYFYKHGPTREGIWSLLEGLDTDFHDVYSLHLWAHLWWDEARRDFSDFHAGKLTLDHIRQCDTTYNVIARGFLD